VTSRPYLSIGDVLTLLREEFPDVTISKIRFLESQGLVNPERSPSGYRKFYEGDVERLRWVLRQQREHFLPLKVIRDRLADGDLADTPATAHNGNVDEPVHAAVGAVAGDAAGAVAGDAAGHAARGRRGGLGPAKAAREADELRHQADGDPMARILADASRRSARAGASSVGVGVRDVTDVPAPPASPLRPASGGVASGSPEAGGRPSHHDGAATPTTDAGPSAAGAGLTSQGRVPSSRRPGAVAPTPEAVRPRAGPAPERAASAAFATGGGSCARGHDAGSSRVVSRPLSAGASATERGDWAGVPRVVRVLARTPRVRRRALRRRRVKGEGSSAGRARVSRVARPPAYPYRGGSQWPREAA